MSRVRLAALAVLALVAAGCGLLPGGGGGTYHVTAFFTRGVALYEQGQVRVLGLPAGHVEEVATEASCPTDDGGHEPCVRVEMDLDEDVELPADRVYATLIPQSLIGERYVQLTPSYTDEMETEDPPPALLADLPEDERVIPLSRTIVPVEPDEALAAVNEFLRSLDPDGLGRLIDNAQQALDGNGDNLNTAIGSISSLVDTFAERDDELASLIDHFDAFTQTLVTRESQIGEIIDSFAHTANLLAQERQNLQTLLASLAQVSTDGLDLVSEHAAALRVDLATLGELGQSLVGNLDSVTQLLDSGPLLVDGLAGAYNPDLRAVNLVTSLSPVAATVVNSVLVALGLPPLPCDLTGFDVLCVVTQSEGDPVATDVPAAHTPIDAVLAVLGSPVGAGSRTSRSTGADDAVADGAASVGRFLRDAAETLTGSGG